MIIKIPLRISVPMYSPLSCQPPAPNPLPQPPPLHPSLSLHASHRFIASKNFVSPLLKSFLLLLLSCDLCDAILLLISLVLIFFCILMVHILPYSLTNYVFCIYFGSAWSPCCSFIFPVLFLVTFFCIV